MEGDIGKELSAIDRFDVITLDRKTAERYKKQFANLADQIPQVEYTEVDVLAESKGERIFNGKWEHSVALFDNDNPIGLVIGYERQGEGNEQYPENTLYVSELAISPEYQGQGLARKLLKEFFDYNIKIGFKHLEGTLNFSIQTIQQIGIYML